MKRFRTFKILLQTFGCILILFLVASIVNDISNNIEYVDNLEKTISLSLDEAEQLELTNRIELSKSSLIMSVIIESLLAIYIIFAGIILEIGYKHTIKQEKDKQNLEKTIDAVKDLIINHIES